MSLRSLLGLKTPNEDIALALYGAIVAQARRAYFYRELKVPDTMEGRYDMIIMHAFLLFHRLKSENEEVGVLGQSVFDIMFKDLDQSLREMGVGDMGIGPRIKKMASSFYGRVTAYDKALENEDDEELKQVIGRNLFNKLEPEVLVLEHIGTYMRLNVAHLNEIETSAFLRGNISFLSPENTP